jgi:outer membrane biosynthesis protein TonB/tetratricopeptide (TPR) repeat protein
MRIDRAGLMGAGIVMAAIAAQVAAQGPATTVQQDFEAAAALDAKGDSTAALAAWTTLEARTKPGSRSRGIALIRKSAALFKLDRADDAVTAARDGLALLPAKDPTLAEDRWRAYFDLGLIAQNALDYAGASVSFASAAAAADGASLKVAALLSLADTTTFTDPAAADAALAKVDALVRTAPADADVKALIARRRAILALNRGQYEQARTQAVEAVKFYGGMTSQTDSRDVSARSDAAIASLLAGKSEEARRYMAMTGAGRLSKGESDPAVQMEVPACGGEADLRPADMAVVEFTIDNDGVVRGVSPIYAAGGGAVALEFARAVRDWSWTPEQTKSFPAFFRYNIRVEMRCSTAFERPSITKFLDADMAAWLESKGFSIPVRERGADAAAIVGQRAALAAAEGKSGPTSLATLPPLYQLVGNAVVGREEAHELAQRAFAIAQANGAPPIALLPLDIRVRETESADSWKQGAYARAITPLLSKPGYAQDPQARSALQLLIADSTRSRSRRVAPLQAVADDKGLAANDPMRVGALIRLASLQQQAGDPVAARATFDRSGLAASQCAILDAPPRFLSAGGTFPDEARIWGFEGWTRTQFDVGPDGKVLNERAVLSYPPFVFTKAGTQTVAGARYTKTFRPDGGVGCGGLSQNVRFKMPG